MEARRLGSTAVTVSAVGLGCNNFGTRLDERAAEPVVATALVRGITFFDTADSYGDGASEQYLGRLLRGRGDVVIATKFGWGDGPGDGVAHGARDAVRRSVEQSLRRLGRDRIDLLYYHRPDGITPLRETVAAMGELVEEGVVRATGCSNVDVADLEHALAVAPPDRLAAVQNEYSVIRREAAATVIPWCLEHDVGFVPSRPLAQGLLTGKYRRGEPLPPGSRLAGRPTAGIEEALERAERVAAFAAARGRTVLELAIGGLASTPGVASVIAGAMTAAQVAANVDAAEWRLDDETRRELEQLP
jgi:aryl-alcohol dehydrogenase-like predicted oxidoreductase